MPIIIDCDQRSDQWFSAICGNVGASGISNIITTKGEPSKSRTEYMMTLCAERITGKQEVGYINQAMLNGIEREAEARTLFEMMHDVEVNQVGLIYLDDKSAHCSPDGLVKEKSGVEIKAPLSKTVIKYHIENRQPIDYFGQIQFSLYVSERETWWFVAYYPAIKPFIIECHRDEKWIEKCEKELKAFNQELEEMVRRLA